MTLHHDTKNGPGAPGYLVRNITRNFKLLFVLLAAVGVAAVNHQRGRQMGFNKVLASGCDTLCVVIRCFAAAQDHMAIGIALRLNNGHLAVFMH